MFWGKNLPQHQQWNYRHRHSIAASAIPLSFQVLDILPVLSRQEQDTASLCPFPTLRTCLHHRICWRSCSTAPFFAVLRIEDWRTRQWFALCVQFVLWRVQLHTMNCSHDLDFEHFTINDCMRFFVSEVVRFSVSASDHNLIAVGFVS